MIKEYKSDRHKNIHVTDKITNSDNIKRICTSSWYDFGGDIEVEHPTTSFRAVRTSPSSTRLGSTASIPAARTSREPQASQMHAPKTNLKQPAVHMYNNSCNSESTNLLVRSESTPSRLTCQVQCKRMSCIARRQSFLTHRQSFIMHHQFSAMHRKTTNA